MARARAAEPGPDRDGNGGAAQVAPPADPLQLVRAAIGGEGLSGLTRRAAEACGRSVAVLLPAQGTVDLWPPTGAHPGLLGALAEYAGTQMAGQPAELPDGVIDAVAVRVGSQVVGAVAAAGPGPAELAVRPWLEAAAAATAVAILMGDADPGAGAGDRARFFAALESQPPADVAELLNHSRALNVELDHGAVGLCALGAAGELPEAPGVLLAEVGAGRVLGLIPLTEDGTETPAGAAVLERLRTDGAVVATSMARPAPELLWEALAEAALLAEVLATAPATRSDLVQEETFRLLIGVLLRTPEELTRLRAQTIAALERYDALHDTELLTTLEAFLAHHGSTTETAEVLGLHRHTVGYRLARVQEVSGLSPYESDGRERLSLGLKADRILAAEARRAARAR